MSQVFANTIDNNPIYAARAEADEDGLNLKQYYAKIADLAAVAFSGSYNDLANTPSIPTKTSDLTNDSGFITASDIPAIPTKTSDLTNDSGFITASDIPAQVNADWNESDPSDPAYIENKPTIPAAQVNSDWNAASGVAQILNKPDMSLYALISSLSTVATSGSYLDLTDLPTISNVPAVTSSDDGKVLKASYSGGTGSYSWETAPSGLPASTSQDAGKLLGVDNNGDPEWQAAPTFTQEQADWNEADSNDPAYIKNKPTIPTVDQTYNASSANAQSGTAVAGAIAGVNQVPASTSADEGKVLKVDANGDPEWGAAPASQVQADWTESDTTDPSYIQNKPTEQALVAGSGITITEANNQVTIGCNVQAPVQDVTFDGVSVVDAQGVAALTSEVEILAYGSTGAWAKFTAAISAGKSVFCRVNPSGNNYRFVPLSYYNINEGTAEFNFHRATPTKNYTTQCDELYVYSLSSSGTWATATKSVALKYLAGVGLDKTTVTNDSITFSVKPKTNGGVNVDSNGVSVDVTEAPSDGKEYVRKNGAWVESSGAVETTLFSDPSGLDVYSSNLVLAQAATDFDKICVYFINDNGVGESTEFIPSASANRFELTTISPWSNGFTYVKTATLETSDFITWSLKAGPAQWRYSTSDGTNQTWNASGSGRIKIIKVIGIKYGVNLYNIDKGRTVLYTGTPTNEVTNMALNPFDYDELKLFLHIGTVDRIYSLGIKGNTTPFQLVVKVYDGASNLWERWIQLTFTTNSVTVNATKRYKVGTISNTTATPSDVAVSTTASDLKFISKIIGFNY